MKSVLTILLIACTFYLSSCTTNSSSSNLTVLPKADSVMNNGFLQISFNGESFLINNLTVLNSPVYTSTSSILPTNITDTLWIGQFQMSDHKATQVSLNLTGYNDVSGAAIGTYFVTTNTSTLTDYSQGQNRVYAVSIGSSINVTNVLNDTTYGTLSLNLYYNNNTYPATGSFKIPN